jgi:formylglycine-generating enzyme required for sulfatase activity
MRLPTEAEWEYAARAGTTESRYGDLAAIAWYHDNSGSDSHEVGTREPNAWGLYDMLGNVWEWVADVYTVRYSPESVIDPLGPRRGRERALRGGSWYGESRLIRASYRMSCEPDHYSGDFGVRCAGDEAALGSPAPIRLSVSGN